MMWDRVYQTPVRDVPDMRQCLIDAWNSLSQSTRRCYWRMVEETRPVRMKN